MARAVQSNTFEAIAREWFAKYSPAWVPGHGDKIISRLEADVFPWLYQAVRIADGDTAH
jgi:hypothetical protein